MNIIKRKMTLASSFIIEIILVLLGLTMFLFGTFKAIDNIVKNKDYVSTSGEITNIIENENERSIYVKYTFGGIEYENKLSYWNAELDIGQTIGILVNSKDPNEFKTSKTLSTFSLIFLLSVGLLIFIYNFTSVLKLILLNNRVNKIIKNGKKESMKIISIEENDSDIRLDVSPKIIECITSEGFPIQSYNIYTRKDLMGYVNKYVSVYFVGEKASNILKNYYIDFETVYNIEDTEISKKEEYKDKFEE